MTHLLRPDIFCLAFLACVLTLGGGGPAAAVDTETFVTPSLAANTITADASESGRSCLWGGRLIQDCIEARKVVVANPDEYLDAGIEVDTLTPPLAATGAAIVVEITQSTTIAAQGETTEEQVPLAAVVNSEPPLAQTGQAIFEDITQSVTIAIPGQVVEGEHDSPAAQVGAAIIVEITQSVTVAAAGQRPEADQDRISVAALPEDEEQ